MCATYLVLIPEQEDAENLEEASNEIMITDEEEVKYMMGECFVYTTEDEVCFQLLDTRTCRRLDSWVLKFDTVIRRTS